MFETEHQPLRFLYHQIVSGYYIVRDKNSIASIKHQTARGLMEKSWQNALQSHSYQGLSASNSHSKTACRASSPSAAGGRCSEARMAQRSKYSVTPPYFGHRKRGCEATSSPFVYLRQSCGDNYCFCFTAFLLAFPI